MGRCVQCDGLTNETHNEGAEATPVHEGHYPRRLQDLNPDDAEDEHVAETVKILREHQKVIMDHLSRKDRVVMELK